MKKYLILVKHSLPEVEKKLPAHRWRLSAEGRERAARLAEKLRRFQPGVIVSSNEPKAKETAEIIAGMHKLELHVVENLHEHDRNDVPYVPQDTFRASVHEFFQKPEELVFGNETAHQAHARFELAVQSVLNSHPNKIVVIVAHGTVISLFVSRRTGVADFLLWNELGLPSYVIVDTESSKLIAKENII